MVRVGVTGRDGLHLEGLGEVAQSGVAALVAPLVRTLELDEESIQSEGTRKHGRAVRIAHREPVARAPGKTDEPLVQLGQQRRAEGRGQHLRPFLRTR